MRYGLVPTVIGLAGVACAPQANLGNSQLGIRVDQFGYVTNAPKIGVLEVDQLTDRRFWVRDVENDALVATVRASRWRAPEGTTAWRIDVSAVTTPGTYRVESSAWHSDPFRIGDDVYDAVLRSAMTTFTLQRAALEVPAARATFDTNHPDAERDLGGGWHHGPTPVRSVTHARSPVHQLLTSFEDRPGVWTDDAGIPESGNGVPDLLDEVRWELDWLQRMQDHDGGVYLEVGPSTGAADQYGPKCTASTLAAAGMFAHAAPVFVDWDPAFSDELARRARRAWDWALLAGASADCDGGAAGLEGGVLSLREQDVERMVAAAYLDAIDPHPHYMAAIVANVPKAGFGDAPAWGLDQPHVTDALRAWMTAPHADPRIVGILEGLFDEQRAQSSGLFGRDAHDAFGAPLPDGVDTGPFVRANAGHINFDVVRLGLDPANHDAYLARGAEAAHYLHGVNPLGVVFLADMAHAGAERSLQDLAEAWGTDTNEPLPGHVLGTPEVSLRDQASYVKLLAEIAVAR